MSHPLSIPLNAVRAIEIVARRGALAPAADELGVTPGAVSQHIRRAEARLGITLFERTPQGLRPTPALREVVGQLGASFAAIEEAVRALGSDEGGGLTVTVGSVFASRWLVWRIGRFMALNPAIEPRLVVTGALVDLARPDIDCGIRYGRGAWPRTRAEPIGGGRYRPVCAPALAEQLRIPADLGRVPVIADTSTMLSWDAWWRAAGIAEPPPVHGPTFDDPALAFDAAIAGHGVLLAVDLMAADAVRDGRLARPFETSAESGVQYWLATAETKRRSSRVEAFRRWLQAELAAEAKESP